jgi:hypothetical protein
MERQKPDPKDNVPESQPDTEINPFLSEEERTAILAGKIQDPEWD